MLNNVNLIGFIVKDPATGATPGGTRKVEMRICFNDVRYDKNTHQKISKQHYFDLIAWGRIAETCEKYLYKGSKVAITGKLESHEWKDKSGALRQKVVINIQSLELLTTKRSQESEAHSDADEEYQGDQ